MFIIKYIVNYNLLLTITKSLRIYDPPKTFFYLCTIQKNNCTPPLFQDTFLITFYSFVYLVNIPDANLRSELLSIIGKNSNDTITK